jgi:predicted transcriptional regulator
MREYIDNYDAGDAPAVAYYVLTSQAYENLANNLADIRRYIRQTLNIIKYYRDNDPTRDNEEE